MPNPPYFHPSRLPSHLVASPQMQIPKIRRPNLAPPPPPTLPVLQLPSDPEIAVPIVVQGRPERQGAFLTWIADERPTERIRSGQLIRLTTGHLRSGLGRLANIVFTQRHWVTWRIEGAPGNCGLRVPVSWAFLDSTESLDHDRLYRYLPDVPAPHRSLADDPLLLSGPENPYEFDSDSSTTYGYTLGTHTRRPIDSRVNTNLPISNDYGPLTSLTPPGARHFSSHSYSSTSTLNSPTMQQSQSSPAANTGNDQTLSADRPSASIERLRAASLVKSSSAIRVNAEPNTPSSGNPWGSPRAVSPVNRTGLSYAAMSVRPASPSLASTAPPVTADAGPASTEQQAVANAATPATPATESTVTEVKVKTEEVEPTLDTGRTRSGRLPSAPKKKASKPRGKKANKRERKQPAETEDELHVPSSSDVSSPSPPSAAPRQPSDVRKRRRVSTDTGDNFDENTGTVDRVQVSPPPISHNTLQAVNEAILVSSTSPVSGGEERDDPPAVTTSDIEPEDVVMRSPDGSGHASNHPRTSTASTLTDPELTRPYTPLPSPGQRPAEGQPAPRRSRPPYGSTAMIRQYIEDQNPPLRTIQSPVHRVYTENDIEDLYTPAGSPDARQTRDLPPHLTPVAGPSHPMNPAAQVDVPFLAQGDATPPALYAAELASASQARASAADKGKGVLRRMFDNPLDFPYGDALDRPPPPARSPSILHPHPVHYAPGPFNVPPAAPIALPTSAPIPPSTLPAGPIAPLAPAPGAPPPRTMTRTPPGGWIPIQGDDLDWAYQNILQSQIEEWDREEGESLFIHFPGQGSEDKGHHGRLTTAETIFTVHLRAPNARITQPIPAIKPTTPNSKPTFYRVSDLTPQQRAEFIRRPFVSTVDGTIGVFSTSREPPTFIGGWWQPERLGKTDEEIVLGFLKGLTSKEIYDLVRSLIAVDIGTGGRWRHLTVEEAHRLVLKSVRVRQIRVREGRDDSDEAPVVLLYIESPTSDANGWHAFRTRVREFAFGAQITPLARAPFLRYQAGTARLWSSAQSAPGEEVVAVVVAAHEEVVAVVAVTSDARIPTVNIHDKQPPTDVSLAPGTPLLHPRETTVSPAPADLDDRMEELGDGAASAALPNLPSRLDIHRGRPPRALLRPTAGQPNIPSGRRTKASLKVCSLNLNGKGGSAGSPNQKWNELNQLLREDKIGLLCLQETHLNDEEVNMLNNLYGRRMAIWNSPSEAASSRQGVAMVLNRELVDTANVQFYEIVPGRAVLLRFHWHADRYLTVLNVYAPNAPHDNAAFWRLLLQLAETGQLCPQTSW
ncbi:uncharacterized protein B0H18DRAFT_1120513 [Fomitopsis serialis]|uniref:uncharacterized protein n=1 Tax=Fomitopsis serialis TaxID=139415 RepID=UPI002007701F|nr:uncharacterized protein B0H18DRAFT_1120513 [Neoantrodia serialis]KAH9923247.1 hypothetical protein B0H18DRAFT_1120513 [Neoantrodia serialis]